MEILNAITEEHVFREKTEFSADEAAAQTVLSCGNASHFAVADYVVLGRPGDDTAEIKKISSISADLITITVDATKFAHAKGEPITQILYNQRKFYRCATEDGTYTHLSDEGSPVDIAIDKPDGTMFEDANGTSTSWYKAAYYNVTTGETTILSDAIATKARDSEHYTSIFKIKQEAGFEENYYVPDELVSRYRDESENQAESSIASVYSLPFSAKPKIFQQIITLLSAGLLLLKEYGLEADVEIGKTGQRKIDRAEDMLQKILDGKLLLRDEDGNELSRTSIGSASGSNDYGDDKADKGEIFNLGQDSLISPFKDPDSPTS